MMKKRIISLLMCIGIFMQLISVTAIAQTEDKSSKKYDILCGLGFFNPDVVYNPNASVQKIELLNAIFSAMPEYKLVSCSDNTGFSDVSAKDEIAKVAYNAYIRGLVGNEKKLNPYAEIGFEDASKIIVNLLGYGVYNKNMSYNALASNLGLTKNMPAGTSFTAEHMVSMLYQALNVELMTFDGKGYKTTPNETFMSEMVCAGYGRGMLNANSYTGIFGNQKVGKGTVMVGSDVFYADDETARQLIGFKIEYYYKLQENDMAKIVYAEPDKSVNITEIDSENIQDYNNFTYRYYSGAYLNQVKKASFSKNSAIIYNGMETESPFNSFLPETGNIKLIDNDGDNINDVVIINDYRVVVVRSYNFNDGIIYDKNDSTKPIKIDKDDGYTISMSDGSVAKISDISENDVLFVGLSQNGDRATLILSKNRVTGVVNGFSEDVINIDNKEYEIAKINYLRENGLESRLSGTFYLDPKGRVVSFEKVKSSALKAGYMTKISQPKDIENELGYEVLFIKFFSEDGEMKRLRTAKKMYFNDTKVDDISQVYNEFMQDNNGIMEFVPQIFQYKTNTDGDIQYLYKAAPYDNDSIENKKELSELNNGKEWLVTNYKWFQTEFRFDNDTVIFAIPNDISKEDNFEVYKGQQPFGWRFHGSFRAYGMESNAAVADYICWYKDESDSSGTPMAIDKIIDAVDDEDNITKLIKGIKGDGECEYLLSYDLYEASLELDKGDVIYANINKSTQKIVDFTKAFDYSERNNITKEIDHSVTGRRNDPRGVFWNVYSVNGTDIMVTEKKPGEEIKRSQTEFLFMQNRPIYKFNGKCFEEMSINDIYGFDSTSEYSQAFSITAYGDMAFCVFYDKK